MKRYSFEQRQDSIFEMEKKAKLEKMKSVYKWCIYGHTVKINREVGQYWKKVYDQQRVDRWLLAAPVNRIRKTRMELTKELLESIEL